MAKKVLVVEDNEALRDLASVFVVDVGYDVKAVTSAEEALELMNSFDPSALLIGGRIYRAKGKEIIRETTEEGRNLAYIVMSGGMTTEEVKALHGESHYLARPFTKEELKATIDSAIEKAERANQVQETLRNIELTGCSAAYSGFMDSIHSNAP
jgi:DNA-binding NtrC family response regulator